MEKKNVWSDWGLTLCKIKDYFSWEVLERVFTNQYVKEEEEELLGKKEDFLLLNLKFLWNDWWWQFLDTIRMSKREEFMRWDRYIAYLIKNKKSFSEKDEKLSKCFDLKKILTIW